MVFDRWPVTFSDDGHLRNIILGTHRSPGVAVGLRLDLRRLHGGLRRRRRHPEPRLSRRESQNF